MCQIVTTCHVAEMCLQPTTWGAFPFRHGRGVQQLCRNVCTAQDVTNYICFPPMGKCMILTGISVCGRLAKMDP